jgi:hypothetical protein
MTFDKLYIFIVFLASRLREKYVSGHGTANCRGTIVSADILFRLEQLIMPVGGCI